MEDKDEAPKLEPGKVLVQITKFGDGKVSTGVHEAGTGDVMAKRGDVLEVDEATAQSMEDKALGEIVE